MDKNTIYIFMFIFFRRKDLASIPDIESCDVLVYLLLWCGWSPERLSRYKQDNGYRSYMACHIDDTIEYHLACPRHAKMIKPMMFRFSFINQLLLYNVFSIL